MNECNSELLEAAMASLRQEISLLREKWYTIRAERLALKKQLNKEGIAGNALRRHKAFREYSRKQQELTTAIRHLEQKFNRKMNQCNRK